MDSIKRTLVKTAVYRGSITLLLFVLLWAFTGNIYETSMITLVFNVAATIIYYFHERIWGKITGETQSPCTSRVPIHHKNYALKILQNVLK